MSEEDEADWGYYKDRVADEAAAEEHAREAEEEWREAIAKLDGGFKHEGEFVAPPQATSARGPWGLFSTVLPFTPYLARVRNWAGHRRHKQEIAYMEKLLAAKGEVHDSILFDRCAEILREARGELWMWHYERLRKRVLHWYRELRYVRWPAFRRMVGF